MTVASEPAKGGHIGGKRFVQGVSVLSELKRMHWSTGLKRQLAQPERGGHTLRKRQKKSGIKRRGDDIIIIMMPSGNNE
jgi:hypothetical protein